MPLHLRRLAYRLFDASIGDDIGSHGVIHKPVQEKGLTT